MAAATVLVCAGLGVVATPGVASPAPRARTIHVEGKFTPLPGSTNEWRTSGDLVGTYRLVSEKVTHTWKYPGVTIKVIEGTDLISGCVDRNHNGRCGRHEPSGTLYFDYKRLANFDAKTGDFLESNCTHPVTKATGAFRNGLVYMRDVAHSGGVASTYRGDVVLGRHR